MKLLISLDRDLYKWFMTNTNQSIITLLGVLSSRRRGIDILLLRLCLPWFESQHRPVADPAFQKKNGLGGGVLFKIIVFGPSFSLKKNNFAPHAPL